MGKGKVILGVGSGLVILIAGLLGLKKEEDKHDEKIRRMISDVDLKKPEEKTVEEMANDVDQAIGGMDIDEMTETVNKINAEIIKETGRKPEDVLKNINVGNGQNAQEWIDGALSGENEKKLTAEELLSEQEKWEKEREEYFRREWPDEVAKAVKAKNYSKLENLFDMKYAGGPWHPSPCSVFADAKADGVIDDATIKGAEKYFGRLWCYSGD